MQSKKVYSLRILKSYTPTQEDFRRLNTVCDDECPRRYCWWWRSLEFDWDIPTQEGCTFLGSEKPPGWPNQDTPCYRAASGSGVDHFETRDSATIEDRIDPPRWIKGRL